jgi:hypothetical protein
MDAQVVSKSAMASLVALIAGGSCGSSSPDPSNGERIPFIAFAKDFTDFRTWPSNTIESPAAATTHVGGLRTVYINQLPAPDATAFPLGTLIVKETAVDGKLFARAKRGGGFNKTGALEWEWFELQENAAGAVGIRWQGFGPPLGEEYGGDPNGGCNLCHKTVPANDYVLAPWLTLGGSGLPPVDLPDAAIATTEPQADAATADALDEEAPLAP